MHHDVVVVLHELVEGRGRQLHRVFSVLVLHLRVAGRLEAPQLEMAGSDG